MLNFMRDIFRQDSWDQKQNLLFSGFPRAADDTDDSVTGLAWSAITPADGNKRIGFLVMVTFLERSLRWFWVRWSVNTASRG
jgi:hypothetical protein